MFKPCPNCGFLVALIAGREASQRCPRCGSAMLEDGEAVPAPEPDVPTPAPRASSRADAADAAPSGEPAPAAHPVDAPGAVDDVLDTPDASGRSRAHEATPPTHARPGIAPQPGAEVATDAATASPVAAPPSFMARGERRTPPRRPGRRWPWAVALGLLALLLGLQLLLSQRAELAQRAAWRPWVVATCGVLGCEVPAWREPGAFAMLARNVRPHATRAGVLHVTTSLRNDARWPQPLPVVVLSLSDVDGRVLAARAVAPADYAGRTPPLVAPGDSVDIAFDVREPSPRVVSFDFQLR